MADVAKIVSGGQTGADRAALDVALELGLAVGGWVPRGRWAEDGPIPSHYPNLRETESSDPAVRTEWNVRDSDATLVLTHGEPATGSALTLEFARRAAKPHLHLDLAARSLADATLELRTWLAAVEPRSLNVAGPRHSQDPAIFEATKRALLKALIDTAGAQSR